MADSASTCVNSCTNRDELPYTKAQYPDSQCCGLLSTIRLKHAV